MRNRDGILQWLIDLVLGTKALASVVAERAKQIEQWGNGHDDDHQTGDLAFAAAGLIIGPDGSFGPPDGGFKSDWWAMGLWRRHRNDRRKQLVIAAALLLAEIERMDRASEPVDS